MLEVLPETKDNLLAVRLRDEITIADFDGYRNLLRKRMQVYPETHLYFEVVDLEWVQPIAAIENGLFDIIHGLDYGRVAMVGEKKWQEWVANLINPFKKKGVQYFDLAEKEQAMQWVQQGE